MLVNGWDDGKKKKALRDLEQRRKKAQRIVRVDNATLMAGSSMTYYCKMCGLVSAVLPEDHHTPAPIHCEPCADMVNHGFSRSTGRFEERH